MQEGFAKQSLTEYKQGIGQLQQKLPEIVEAYNAFTKACFQEGTLSKKEKHLIALALGVYTNDEYCMVYHTKGACDQGASEQEVLEAACVASAFGGGMAMSQAATLVRENLSQIKGQPLSH